MTAALQGIPRELYESAFVDGAGGWMRFTNVTLPMLGADDPVHLVVLTTRAFQAYAEIDLLTGGGPDPATTDESVAYLIYGQNSLVKNDIGLKSTSAVLLFFVLLSSRSCSSAASTSGCTMAASRPRATETRARLRGAGPLRVLIFVAFLVLFPIYATLMQALKSGPTPSTTPKSLLPINFTLDTLRDAWRIGDLGRLLLNSTFVAWS